MGDKIPDWLVTWKDQLYIYWKETRKHPPHSSSSAEAFRKYETEAQHGTGN